MTRVVDHTPKPGEGDIHIVPKDGEYVHEETDPCWCAPKLHYQDPVTLRRVWIHHNRESSN